MLTALIQRFSLPLLAKDLVETANRKRTYVLRVVYALLLYGLALLIYVAETGALRKTTFELLGSGKDLLSTTLALQCVGICLFMPALTVGAIAVEKEKNTLTLLFLTRLGPWTILFEKYLSRVVLMASYLLISVPLLGLAYCMGGVTQLELWSGVWMLLLFTTQVGAISILCSAFFRSTVAAFICTYIIGATLYLVPVFVVEGLELRGSLMTLTARFQNSINGWAMPVHAFMAAALTPAMKALGYSPGEISEFQLFRPIAIDDEESALLCFPLGPYAFTFWDRGSPSGPAFWHVLIRSVPVGFSTLVCLGLARWFLVSRAVTSGGNWGMAILKGLDGFFHRLNQNRWTQGKVLIRDTEVLPLDRPIAWRETKKRAFGTFRYLVRMLLLVEFPTLVVCLLFLALSSANHNLYWNRNEVMIFLSIILWILSLLFLVSKAATVLPSERLGETFDVLLSTPMSTREIVWQKFAGVNRLIWMLSVPLVTVTLTHAIWIEAANKRWWIKDGLGWYLLGGLGAIVVYFRMVAWLSMLIGLAVKSQTKAIFISLAILVGWCILPIICLFIWDEILGLHLSQESILAHLAFAQSPATLIVAVESAEFGNQMGVIVIVSLIEYTAIWITLREICFSAAATMLGRPETPELITRLSRERRDHLASKRAKSDPLS